MNSSISDSLRHFGTVGGERGESVTEPAPWGRFSGVPSLVVLVLLLVAPACWAQPQTPPSDPPTDISAEKLCDRHPEVLSSIRREAVRLGRGLRLARYREIRRDNPTLGNFADSAVLGGRTCPGALANAVQATGAILFRGTAHCTGTLVGENTVLTAAHCIDGFDVLQMEFVSGQNASQPDERANGVDSAIHPDYDNRRAGRNDIAVLYLGSAMVRARPMDYRRRTLEEVGVPELLIVGYGTGRGDPGTRRCVHMPIAEVCSTTFSYQVPDRNTCNGDSGGPAVERDGAVFRLAGITAWGDAACVDFGVNTDVGAYGDWIGARIHEAPEPTPRIETMTPRLVSPQDEARFSHHPRQTALSWEPVAAAVRYRLERQIRAPAGGLWHPYPFGEEMRIAEDTTFAFEFIGDQPCRWRVTAIDLNGNESEPSQWWEFSYVPEPTVVPTSVPAIEPFARQGGVLSGSCGGCCLFGTCQPPSRRDTIVYQAPPGYEITGQATIRMIAEAGEGGHESVVYHRDASGRIIMVTLEIWCRSQNQAAGAGAWRTFELAGSIRRIE